MNNPSTSAPTDGSPPISEAAPASPETLNRPFPALAASEGSLHSLIDYLFEGWWEDACLCNWKKESAKRAFIVGFLVGHELQKEKTLPAGNDKLCEHGREGAPGKEQA